MSTARRGAVKDVVLLVVALLLIGAAVFIYMRMSTPSDANTEKNIPFVCMKCKHQFKFSERDIDQAFDRKQFRNAPGKGAAYFKCPKCGELEATKDEGPAGEPSEK